MAKIWEIQYTTFSGTFSDEPQDTVGSGHLTSIGGSAPVSVEPGPLFNIRHTVQVQNNGVEQGYNNFNVDESKFGTAFYGITGRRSFVLWMYKVGNGDSDGGMWVEGDGTFPRSGIRVRNSRLVLDVNGVNLYDSPTGFDASQWHLVVLTVDPFAAVPSDKTKLYLDSTLLVSSSSTPTTSYSRFRIGDYSSSREANCIFGYTATYDHILNQAEVDNIYESFLVDSNDPANFPFAEVSGRVFDSGGLPLAAADVIAFDSASDEVVAQDITTSGGNYSLQFSSAGSFKVIASKPGVLGGKVAEATVSGGTVTFVTS